MREILFRGKSVDDNEWVYGSLCIDAVEQLRGADCGANAFIRFYDVETKKMKMIEVQRETVGQYTGLTDRNGEKIFEGDICKCGYDDEYVGEWFYDVFDFSITGIDDENVFNLLVFDKKKEEWFFQGVVVGNAHNNPKLLEQLQEEK